MIARRTRCCYMLVAQQENLIVLERQARVFVSPVHCATTVVHWKSGRFHSNLWQTFFLTRLNKEFKVQALSQL